MQLEDCKKHSHYRVNTDDEAQFVKMKLPLLLLPVRQIVRSEDLTCHDDILIVVETRIT